MPVSTRSQSVSSPRAITERVAARHGPNREDLGSGDSGMDGFPGLARTDHFANLRSLSRGKLMVASDGQEKPSEPETGSLCLVRKNTEARQAVKSSHASVDLLTPRVVGSESAERRRMLALHSGRRNSSVGEESALETQAVAKMAGVVFKNDRMQECLETPLPYQGQTFSPQVIGAYDWAKNTTASSNYGESGFKGRSRPRAISRVAFSCPKPVKNTDCTEKSRFAVVPSYGGQTELRPDCRMRKRPFNEELETVKEEGGQAPGTRIMVYVRLRPMSKKEKEAGARSCVRVVNKRDIYLTEFALETDYLRLKRLKGRHFAFDASFPDNTGQQEVYNTSTAELVEGVLQGRNGSVFCYGATGAGKTHTMLGTVQSPGVMVLALKDLFSKLRQRSREGDYVVRLSYLEVYNESVRDLLSPGRPLVLREDSRQGIVAAGLTQYQAYSADEVMALLQQGNQNRTTEPTRLNETSSRSHAILQVVVEYKEEQQDSVFVSRVGKLSLIDLAGSERALATDQRTIRSLEGANINRSLLALSSCINALVEGKRHIPFRNSKLTQLLKDSLGGACQTSMIANVSPSNLSFGETQNTLHWADRAKEIRTKACTANEELLQVPESETEQAKLLLEVQKENQQLRMQLARLQQKLLTIQSNAMAVVSPAQLAAASAPSPFTPHLCRTPEPAAAGVVAHHNKNNSSRNDEEEGRRTIQELQRTVQALEKEREHYLQESALREEKLTESIASLNRDHSLQLRHKDHFIRTLVCQKKTSTTTTAGGDGGGITTVHTDKIPAAAACKSAKPPPPPPPYPVTVRTRRMSSSGGGGDDAAIRPSISSSRRVLLTPHNNKTANNKRRQSDAPPTTTTTFPCSSKQQQEEEEESRTSRRTGRVSRIPHPPPKTPLPRFSSPVSSSTCRKRTFWDITNANSPSAGTGRCTRSNTAATPSMLLQPGFLRGRPSLN